MRKLLLLLAILVLVSCDPFAPATPWVVTATPGIVTNTPQPLTPGPSPTEETPTAEASNPHALLPEFSVVNQNADLSIVPKQVEEIVRGSGVFWDIPQGWSGVWRPADVDATPPVSLGKRTLGYEFNLHDRDRNGRFGLREPVILYSDQRYGAKISFIANLEGTDNISVCLRIYNSDGGTQSALRCMDFPLAGYSEIIVPIETRADQPTVEVEWFFDQIWATTKGFITIQRIEVLTLRSGWGEDALLRF